MRSLLLVAGEASGDDLASGVLSHLTLPVWGVGGPRSVGAGLRSLAPLPSVMGVVGVAGKVGQLFRLHSLLLEHARRHVPAAALLVGFSEFNTHLSRALVRLRVPVVWYAPPQVWAWRAWRARSIAAQTTLLATLFEFEVELWSRVGGTVHHVGHPASLIDPRRRTALRDSLGMQSDTALLLLPGSRIREVERHAPVLSRAGALLLDRGIVSRVALALAPSLPSALAARLRRSAAEGGIETLVGTAVEQLPAFDAAVCCSGTATLECAAAGVPPVIVYDAGILTHAAARYMLRIEHIGLPNLLLNHRVFPELLGGDVRPESIGRAVLHVLGSQTALDSACRTIRERLHIKPGTGLIGCTPGQRVANLLAPWLA